MDQSASVMVAEIRKAIVEEEFDLSEWEEGFFASVADCVEKGRPLSAKQDAKLLELWTKATK